MGGRWSDRELSERCKRERVREKVKSTDNPPQKESMDFNYDWATHRDANIYTHRQVCGWTPTDPWPLKDTIQQYQTNEKIHMGESMTYCSLPVWFLCLTSWIVSSFFFFNLSMIAVPQCFPLLSFSVFFLIDVCLRRRSRLQLPWKRCAISCYPVVSLKRTVERC